MLLLKPVFPITTRTVKRTRTAAQVIAGAHVLEDLSVSRQSSPLKSTLGRTLWEMSRKTRVQPMASPAAATMVTAVRTFAGVRSGTHLLALVWHMMKPLSIVWISVMFPWTSHVGSTIQSAPITKTAALDSAELADARRTNREPQSPISTTEIPPTLESKPTSLVTRSPRIMWMLHHHHLASWVELLAESIGSVVMESVIEVAKPAGSQEILRHDKTTFASDEDDR